MQCCPPCIWGYIFIIWAAESVMCRTHWHCLLLSLGELVREVWNKYPAVSSLHICSSLGAVEFLLPGGSSVWSGCCHTLCCAVVAHVVCWFEWEQLPPGCCKVAPWLGVPARLGSLGGQLPPRWSPKISALPPWVMTPLHLVSGLLELEFVV